MCAIHGFCWPNTERQMERMIESAHRRGPDGSGLWGDEHITLGHNLLAIADTPEASQQPWHHGQHVLTYNGEIYNYEDLRRSLTHHAFRTDSDTEVLAVGLAEHGVDFLKKIDGMFALAWYDKTTHELVLARDSNGTKPLYCGDLNGRLAFSSEIGSLLALGFERKVSREAFCHYYYSGLVAGPLTMFEGIHKLIPGQVVRVHIAGTRAWMQHNLNGPVAPYEGQPEDIPHLLRDKLRQGVKLTMMGRRRLGVFLSGGMDSSAILFEAVHGLQRPPRTFSSRFVLPHALCQHNQDADLAHFLATKYGCKHREHTVDQQTWLDHLEPTVLALEEPRQGKSYSAYHACYELLRHHGVIVALSGDGGDELLMGYKHQQDHPTFLTRFARLRAGHRELRNPLLQLPLDRQLYYLNAWMPRGTVSNDATNTFLYQDCLHTLSEDFLIRNDKLGAAFGMEARFPMLCNAFRDFARSLPSAVKASPAGIGSDWDTNNKPLLRAAYAGRLPHEITGKPKTGWRSPTDDWIVGISPAPAVEGPIRAYIRETLRCPLIRDLFEITEDMIENRYLNNRDFEGPPKPSGKPSAGPGLASQKELFTVLMFAVWFRLFNMRLW